MPFKHYFNPDKARVHTRINHYFNAFQSLLQSRLIKTSIPLNFYLYSDQSRVQTRINHYFNPVQSRLQSLSIFTYISINQDFKPGSIMTSIPLNFELYSDQLMLKPGSIITSMLFNHYFNPDQSRVQTRIDHDFKPSSIITSIRIN